jgi:murein DD-endopeptidase MepM/ murein hydrolase activator NlpD
MARPLFSPTPRPVGTLLLLVLGLSLGLGLEPAGAPQPARASLTARWARASFPVASFVAYTSPFGLRVHPLQGGVRPHLGLDIAAPLGSVVRNWWGGTLVEILRDSGCGNGLVIRSGPYEHLYCHLAGRVEGNTYRSGSVLLVQGQALRTGQTIGHVGLTGSTTGPHLHWGIRHGDRWLDPAAVLRAMAEERRRGRASQATTQQTVRRAPVQVGQTF